MSNIKQKLTRLEWLQERCKEAYYAGISILFLETNEMELVDDLILSDCMVMRRISIGKDQPTVAETKRKCEELKKEAGTDDTKRTIMENLQKTCMAAEKEMKYFNVDIQQKMFENFSKNLFDVNEDMDYIIGVKNFTYKENEFSREDGGYQELLRYLDDRIHKHSYKPFQYPIVILAAPVACLPQALKPYVEIIKVPVLKDWEIRDIVLNYTEIVFGEKIVTRESKIYFNKLLQDLRGFSPRKICEILTRIRQNAGSIFSNDAFEKFTLGIVRREKQQMLASFAGLSVVNVEDPQLGGLDLMLIWLENCGKLIANANDAEKNGKIISPRGVLVSGIPGSGKSLMAKKAAQIMGLPLIKMDMGALMGSYLGESETNIRMAMSMIESLSPCVLWIDELEKSFSGVQGNGESDGGTLLRSFSSFLTWMQERVSPCFVFATANDISRLPPEFLRRGRFDRKFYVFLPKRDECVEIFKAQLREHLPKEDNEKDEVDTIVFENGIMSPDFICNILHYCVSCQSDGSFYNKFLTGADISGLINDTMARLYLENYCDKISYPEILYTKKMFEETIKKVIDETRTYGETDLHNAAACFIALHQNKFNPASADQVLNFKDFNPCPPTGKESINIAYNKGDDENPYDKALFEVLKQEINRMVKEKGK